MSISSYLYALYLIRFPTLALSLHGQSGIKAKNLEKIIGHDNGITKRKAIHGQRTAMLSRLSISIKTARTHTNIDH